MTNINERFIGEKHECNRSLKSDITWALGHYCPDAHGVLVALRALKAYWLRNIRMRFDGRWVEIGKVKGACHVSERTPIDALAGPSVFFAVLPIENMDLIELYTRKESAEARVAHINSMQVVSKIFDNVPNEVISE